VALDRPRGRRGRGRWRGGVLPPAAAPRGTASRLRLVRFDGANDAADTIQSDLWLDYLAIEQHEFHLDIVDGIAGVAGSAPYTLRLIADRGSAGDNVDVYVYNWTEGAWTPWLSAPFTSTDQTFQVTLSSSQLQSGEVHVRFVNHGIPGLRVAGVLLVDLLEAQAGP